MGNCRDRAAAPAVGARRARAAVRGRGRQSLAVAGAARRWRWRSPSPCSSAAFRPRCSASRGCCRAASHLARAAAAPGGDRRPSAAVAVVAAGMLVQVPWLLLPVLFAGAHRRHLHLSRSASSPIRGYALVLTLAGVFYTAVFAPQRHRRVALGMAVAFAIGITVATPRRRARRQRAAARRARGGAGRQLHTRARPGTRRRARFRAPAFESRRGDRRRSGGAWRSTCSCSRGCRQERRDPDVERAFVALITAAERAATFGAWPTTSSRQPGGRRYRAPRSMPSSARCSTPSTGLARFAAAAAKPGRRGDGRRGCRRRRGRGRTSGRWWRPCRPASDALVAAGATAAIEGRRVGHAERLRAGPRRARRRAASAAGSARARAARQRSGAAPVAAALRSVRGADSPPRSPSPACWRCVVGVASHVRALETCILNPLILAQGSYGATIRKAGLRLTGVLLGGALAVLTVIAAMANTDDLAVWLVVFFALMLPCAYVALGSPRLSYLGLQVGATYMIVMVANAPVVDVHVALWRFFGTVLGALILFAVFEVVAARLRRTPDRQPLRRPAARPAGVAARRATGRSRRSSGRARSAIGSSPAWATCCASPKRPATRARAAASTRPPRSTPPVSCGASATAGPWSGVVAAPPCARRCRRRPTWR